MRIIGSGLPETMYLVGTVTTITGPSVLHPGEWRLDLRHNGLVVTAHPKRLAPVYDGDERAKWADCVWQPSVIQAGM